jgi:enamine deaminase RidA (YjgF/YER057c/UK114 family)
MALTFRPASTVSGCILLGGAVGRGPDGKLVPGIVPQTQAALGRIEATLKTLGKTRNEIARLRIYLIDVAAWPTVRAELEAFFGPICPPCTVVGVTALVEPAMLIEIDSEAAA